MPFELRPYPNETLRPEGDYLRRASGLRPFAQCLQLLLQCHRQTPVLWTRVAWSPARSVASHVISIASFTL